jgi:SAM-dependent methyltransferase
VIPGAARGVVNYDEAIQELERFVAAEFARRDIKSMLDAGCGDALPFAFRPGVRIVGLDASPEALARNEYIESGIVGDIETYPLPPAEFDAVLCWTVLEHLSNPRVAVANMARALRPEGLLIVGVPNLWSLKGLLTKLTPHPFHVWAYRHIWGFTEAGTPGFGPYRTHLRRDIAPDRLAEVARDVGLERIYESTYGLEPRLPSPLNVLWSAATTLGRIATLGNWKPRASEHAAVFRRLP